MKYRIGGGAGRAACQIRNSQFGLVMTRPLPGPQVLRPLSPPLPKSLVSTMQF